ncbi:hypothetical protein [Arcticibacterium luteifluviistationis]|uniref:Uncharacterized protein n=1 Tax=Arcticibacterium luteifluviistationis TaxID=1784714 RepID=A0A2Z4GHK0_9BACT|nr:hypothetical protein [Arcticibacterium luteifluviistationis]AWW00485.1 hypothetical protein DJ013_20800 [Arcticibacterium luteifluviistationis]
MSEQDLEILEAYLKSGKEDKELEVRLKNEPELSEALASMTVVYEGFQRQALRDKIIGIHQSKMTEWSDEKVVNFTPNRVYIKVVSALAAACLVFTIYLGNASFELPNQLVLEERGATDSSVGENEVYQKYIKAQDFLGEGDFKEAANAFSELKSNTDLRTYYQDAARWYEVVALSEVDEEKASLLFDELQAKEPFKYPISIMERLKMKVRLLF